MGPTNRSSANSAPRVVRLNKYIAECGVASRRKADHLITGGRVTINGKKVFELGVKIDPRKDEISVDGNPIRQEAEKVYFMMNKPRLVVTTMDDPEGRPSVADYLRNVPYRVFPIGRLDWDSEGLLLLTNDGDFAQKVMHPREEITKTYMVKVNGTPADEQLQKLTRGIPILGGRVSALEVQRVGKRGSEQYEWIRVVIGEGKNRQIRKMFEKIGFDVIKLQRVAIGELKLGTLERGGIVDLTPAMLQKVFINPIKKEKPPRKLSPKRNTRPSKLSLE